MSIKTDQYSILLSDFNGMASYRNSDSLPIGKSPNILNCRIRGSHFIGSEGYEIVGTRNETEGKILSQYTYNRNDGQQRMVRVKDDGATGVLQWYDETNDDWYDLLPGLTTGNVMGFTEFNTSATNQMIFCNGVDNMSVWTGAITRLTAAVSLHDTQIHVVDNSDFPASGTIIYNGTEIAYTSKTGTTILNVADAHASAGTDDGVAQAVDDSTHSAITKGNILYSAANRLLIAGQLGAPTSLDGSDEGTAFTFTGGANRTDSFSEDFLNIGGRISGLNYKDGKYIVLGPDGAVALSFVYPTSITKAPVYENLFISPGQGCLSAQSVVNINNEIYFASRDGVVALTDLIGTDKTVPKRLTDEILPTLQDYVFDEVASFYDPHEDILMVACKSSDVISANDIVIALDFYHTKDNVRTFGITRFDWPVAAFAKLGDLIYFGSSLEMNSFLAFSTNLNDGAARTIRYATQVLYGNEPFQEKKASLVAVRGYIKDGTDITVDINFNGGFLSTQSKTIESTGDYVSAVQLNAIGTFALGTNPIGENIDIISDLKRFLVYMDIGVSTRWNDISFTFSSDTEGGNFIIDFIGLAAQESGYASRQDMMI